MAISLFFQMWESGVKLAINCNKCGAPFGMEHGRAVIPFSVVESARDLHESGVKPKQIQGILEEKLGQRISINTLNSWLYYQTRIYG